MNDLILKSPYNPMRVPSGGLNFLRRGHLAEQLGFVMMVVFFAVTAVAAIGLHG